LPAFFARFFALFLDIFLLLDFFRDAISLR
jgi:hypothetical protein